MAHGFESFRGALKEIEERRQAGGTGFYNWFRLQAGETGTVRFLEQGDKIAWCWAHELPESTQGGRRGVLEPCINQDSDGEQQNCPGCALGYKRKLNGFINLIWRDGPILKKDESGRAVRDENNKVIVEKRGPMLAVWRGGAVVFGQLDKLDAKYKGLISRDFTVERVGDGLNTKYAILPEDEVKPLSPEDEALAEQKYDLMPLITPPSVDEWGKQSNSGGVTPEQVATVNPFMGARRD